MVLRTSCRLLAGSALIVGLALAVAPAAAEKKYDEGASDTEIRIGHTNPYTGPASAYGVIGMTIGAYFKMVNDNGGINGRKVTLISYDDGYNPKKTVELVKKLVEEDKVLLVFQTLGTPPNVAIQGYLNERKIPQLFVATGASRWRNPTEFPWTMGWQPNYVTEAAAYAKDILAYVKDPKIAVLMQNDEYGKDYFEGFKQGLGKDADRIVKVATYEVTDANIDNQVVLLKYSGANVFFNIATPKFATQAIRKAAEIGWKPVHYLNNVATSVGGVLRPAGLESAQGIISVAYLKDGTAPQWAESPDVAAWHGFIDKYMPQADKSSSWYVYGYAVSATLVEVLKRSGDELTRANVMKQAASLRDLEVPMLLPHIKINTSPESYNPIQSVRLQRFLGERWDYSLAAWLAFLPQEAERLPQAAPAPAKAVSAKAPPARPKAAVRPRPKKQEQATQ
jgi:branched-chain amino acid transport system substrate-binding protein